MNLNIISSLLLCGHSVLTLCFAPVVSGYWPNSFPKQIATLRRRPGLTQAEYLYHHSIVHGQKAWNAPDSVDQPLAYIQDHVFDSAYGDNTSTVNTEPSYFGHQDVTELYSRSEAAFRTPPPNNYTATVIGPDGNAFNDFPAALSLYAYEKFQKVQNTCATKQRNVAQAFYWTFSAAANANTASFNNASFAAPILSALLTALPSGTIYNASIHTPVPDLDSRPYYGGLNNPTVNAVLKFWLCNDHASVFAFRKAQLDLVKNNDRLGINLSNSFVQFTKPLLMYDRTTGDGFNLSRVKKVLMADAIRGDVVLNGPTS